MSLNLFSTKAHKYARYRWDYASQAIELIFATARLSPCSTVADIGAGSGILARHFAGKVGQIYALEPDPAMRSLARIALAGIPGCSVLAAQAEALPLPDACLDLLAVAQAIHWFEPQPARSEFWRTLKSGGWLAILRNFGTHEALNQALQGIYPAEIDTGALMKGRDVSPSYYFGQFEIQARRYPFTTQQTWEQFFGALSSASYAPDEDSPHYAAFQQAARQVFERFSQQDILHSWGITELYLGQVQRAADSLGW